MKTITLTILLMLVIGGTPSAQIANAVTHETTRVDLQSSWVGSVWGANAPKMVYDGENFYCLGFWGDSRAESYIKIYKLVNGSWVTGHTFTDANYQPGVLLLDSTGRLIVVHSRVNEKPKVFRSNSPGDIDNFTEIVVPPMAKAGYLGACIYEDVLTIGYIGSPGTYSFNLIKVDITTESWSGPSVLATEQRANVPYTTWLYPLMRDYSDGIHLTISNGSGLSNLYNKVVYMHVSHDLKTVTDRTTVREVAAAGSDFAFADSMWVANDGHVYLNIRAKDQGPQSTHTFRRDPSTGMWSQKELGYGIQASFQVPLELTELWKLQSYGSRIRLLFSTNDVANWTEVDPGPFNGPANVGFLQGIVQGSGSVIPDGPAALYNDNSDNSLWFTKFDGIPAPTSTPTSSPSPTHTETPSPSPTFTQNFDVAPEQKDGIVDALDLVEFLRFEETSGETILEFSHHWLEGAGKSPATHPNMKNGGD